MEKKLCGIPCGTILDPPLIASRTGLLSLYLFTLNFNFGSHEKHVLTLKGIAIKPYKNGHI